MVKMGDDETLRRFVLRARRVQAHSVVQDWDELLRHGQGSFVGHLDLAGRMTITRRLPADEEVFESRAVEGRVWSKAQDGPMTCQRHSACSVTTTDETP